MPLNQLLHQHQLAKLNAATAETASARASYRDLAGDYASRIGAWRRTEGLPEAGWPSGARAADTAKLGVLLKPC